MSRSRSNNRRNQYQHPKKESRHSGATTKEADKRTVTKETASKGIAPHALSIPSTPKAEQTPPVVLPPSSDVPSTTEQSLTADTLSFDKLVEICEKVKQDELAKHTKTKIEELHEPRKSQLFFIDTLIQYLQHNAFGVSQKDKQNLLLGAMAFVSRRINDSYIVRKARYWSLLCDGYENVLELYNPDKDGKQINELMLKFANYFIDNRLSERQQHPVLGYTIADVKQVRSVHSGFSLFRLFGSSSEPRSGLMPDTNPTPVVAPKQN